VDLAAQRARTDVIVISRIGSFDRPALSQFNGSEQAVTFFLKPHQVHLGLANLLEQFAFLGLALRLCLAFFALGEKLTGSFQELALPFGSPVSGAPRGSAAISWSVLRPLDRFPWRTWT